MIPVRCTLPDGAIFDVIANDISSEGLRFYMSNSPVPPSVGDSLKLRFDTPGLEGVSVSGTIKNSSKVLDMACFRVCFDEVSDGDQPKLAEYRNPEAHRTHRGVDLGREDDIVPEGGVLFVIDEPAIRDTYGFLERSFDVLHSDSFDVISQLLSASPDAILLSSCLPDAPMVLQVLTGHPILRATPVIEVQRGKPKTSGRFFASLSSPLDEGLVLETFYRAIEAKRISTSLHEGEFSGPFKTGLSILLVDDSPGSEEYDLEVLRGLDCEVKRISNLKLLYDAFAWSTPDVIAIDEGTREVDARTVCRLLNMNRELKDVPKLLLSERKGRGISDQSALFSSVLTKPFTAKQFLSRVHYLFRQTSK